MSPSRRHNQPPTNSASEAVTNATSSQKPFDDAQFNLLKTVLILTPVSIFTLFILVLSYTLMQPEQLSNIGDANTTHIKQSADIEKPTPPVPTLNQILTDVADALDNASVTYWLMPGLDLFPITTPPTRNRKNIGRLNPWQEGIDLAVFQRDLMQILLAQANLQQHGILAVESYYGLRLFPITGTYDERYDFRTPFVDLFYFTIQQHNLTNSCCDCGPVTISACTKKMCSCLECTFPMHQIFPLTTVHIQSVRRAITAPRNVSSLLLPTNLPGVHPSVFTSIDS